MALRTRGRIHRCKVTDHWSRILSKTTFHPGFYLVSIKCYNDKNCSFTGLMPLVWPMGLGDPCWILLPQIVHKDGKRPASDPILYLWSWPYDHGHFLVLNTVSESKWLTCNVLLTYLLLVFRTACTCAGMQFCKNKIILWNCIYASCPRGCNLPSRTLILYFIPIILIYRIIIYL